MDRGERIGERGEGVAVPVPARRNGAVARVKFTAVTRRLTSEVQVSFGAQPDGPRLGRFVVARVLATPAGVHVRDRAGRPVRLYPDDLIAGAWAQSGSHGVARARLLTSGGLMGDGTCIPCEGAEVEVMGFISDLMATPLSTGAVARMPSSPAIPAVGTIAVIGTDGCNDDVAAAVVNGWARTGFAVGAGRVSGEENGTQRWSMLDAGAEMTADFLDFGMPATNAYPLDRRAGAMLAIRDALVADGAQVVVLQLDDGGGPEARSLLGRLASMADAAVVCAVDEQDARFVLDRIDGLSIPVRAVSGPAADDRAVAARIAARSGMPVRSVVDLRAGAAASLLATTGSAPHIV